MFLDETLKYSYKQAGNFLWRILMIFKQYTIIVKITKGKYSGFKK